MFLSFKWHGDLPISKLHPLVTCFSEGAAAKQGGTRDISHSIKSVPFICFIFLTVPFAISKNSTTASSGIIINIFPTDQ